MIKINMGCGWRNFGKDWIHIDGGNYEHIDYHDVIDLSQFETDSVDLIHASHLVEYFDRIEVVKLLSEWKRVLKSGGVLRIAVPNFDVLSKLYMHDNVPLKDILGPLYGRMKMQDDLIFHKTTYDFKDLELLLKDAGFRNIKLFDWKTTENAEFDDHSQAYYPHMDKENGTLISLNIECVK
tara:strand:+ start:1135 stop:1677 length:543 start_codon:yes stop_codon:yes gene_type:complete